VPNVPRRVGWTAAGAAVGAVAVLAGLAWVSAASPVELWHDPPPRAARSPVAEPAPLPTLPAESLPRQGPPGPPPDLTWLRITLLVVAGVLAVAALVAIVRWLRRVSWRLPWSARGAERDVEPLADVAAAVSDAREELHETLRRGSPRNAIVACWVRLERAVADAGIAPRPSETSSELTTRVLSERALDAGAIGRLAGLYREARFSEHALGEADRERAIVALTAVIDSLQAAPVEAVPG